MSRPPKIITRPRAWGCAVINQLVFPGLGTIMAGRRGVGYLQAACMVIGFCLFVGFMLWFFVGLSLFAVGEWGKLELETHCRPFMWALWGGLALSALAWIWALISSVSILRQTKK